MTQNRADYNFVADDSGARLDKYVTSNCPELSRTRVQKLIADCQVLVNDKPAKAGWKLEPGDRVSVTIPRAEPSRLSADDIPVKIIFENDDLLVVDKPAGLAVHPAPGHPDHTLVNALLGHLADLPEPDGETRPGIVHRLDMDTSGVMVIARNVRAHADLTDQFKNRTVTKIYRVLVKGHLSPEEGVIEAPVGRDPRHRERMAITPESRGREARTEYRVLEYISGFSLLEVRPITGRTHQIRVHFKAIGYPVAGDSVYGVAVPGLKRQFVHALTLGFKLPGNGEYAEFSADLPDDLEQALRELRGS